MTYSSQILWCKWISVIFIFIGHDLHDKIIDYHMEFPYYTTKLQHIFSSYLSNIAKSSLLDGQKYSKRNKWLYLDLIWGDGNVPFVDQGVI
jgi:hypothetical protein